MDLLLLLGLPLVLLVVFVWRSDIVTGAIGVMLGAFCTLRLLQTIQANDSLHTWNAALISRTWYEVLVAGCAIAVVTSAYSCAMGLINIFVLRQRALVLVPDTREGPVGAETRPCPHCGKRIPVQAVVCSCCESEEHPRAR